MTFAEKIKTLLDEAGVTPYRLALQAGMPVQTVTNLASGLREPTLASAQQIVKTLGKSLSEFDDVVFAAKDPKHKIAKIHEMVKRLRDRAKVLESQAKKEKQAETAK